MSNYATEIINLEAGINYEPTFIRTDNRLPANVPTTLGYLQIGELQQYGNARGPIFRIEFADTSTITATHVKIWGLDNADINAPIYPIAYLQTWRPILDVYVKKFIFCDASGTEIIEDPADYAIIGYKRKTMPTVF
jgi:hypothetical protein